MSSCFVGCSRFHILAIGFLTDGFFLRHCLGQSAVILSCLPVGQHEFRVWHERCGYVEREFKVTVLPGSQQLSDLQVDIAKLEKRPRS